MRPEEDSDRLSNLPESVLITNILSKLPVKEMVQTCVLSKKWRFLWTFVQCLYFNAYRDQFRDRSEKFENFVTQFLRLRDDATDLHTFSLFDRRNSISVDAARMWLLYALKHNPKKLDIDLGVRGGGQFHIPDCLFTCESLEDICFKLFMEGEDEEKIETDIVCLPKVKTLEIGGVRVGAEFMQKLLNGCPALESLYFYQCTLEMETISFLQLKNLGIMYCSLPPSLCISAQVLEFLRLAGEVGPGTKLVDMCNVTSVDIEELPYDEAGIAYNLQLLNSLPRIHTLNIMSDCFKFGLLEGELSRCRKFDNLKKLNLGHVCMHCHFDLLSSLLTHCPNLEVLDLGHNYRDECQDEHVEEEDEKEIGSFGCKNLKRINVFYDGCDDVHVDRLVRLLVKSTRAIDQVQIIVTKT